MNITENFLQVFQYQPFFDVLIFASALILFATFLKTLLLNRFDHPKYKFSGRLFSRAEHSFFMALHQAIGNDFQIFAKIRIADILTPDKQFFRGKRQSAFNKISSKHFDYVLCDKATLKVLAVIELDDKSHELPKIQKRDIFIQKACSSAGLKLFRFKCKSGYNFENIRAQIFALLDPSV